MLRASINTRTIKLAITIITPFTTLMPPLPLDPPDLRRYLTPGGGGGEVSVDQSLPSVLLTESIRKQSETEICFVSMF